MEFLGQMLFGIQAAKDTLASEKDSVQYRSHN